MQVPPLRAGCRAPRRADASCSKVRRHERSAERWGGGGPPPPQPAGRRRYGRKYQDQDPGRIPQLYVSSMVSPMVAPVSSPAVAGGGPPPLPRCGVLPPPPPAGVPPPGPKTQNPPPPPFSN